MSAGAVIKVDHEFNSEGWRHVLRAFGIGEVYELPGLGVPLGHSVMIERAADAVNYHDAKLVVIQNPDGDFVQGVDSLTTFEHPEDAIYIFGGSLARMTEFDLTDAQIHAYVYIPVGALYPHQAGAVVFWDRLIKRGPE